MTPFLVIFMVIMLSGRHQTRATKAFYTDIIDHFNASCPVFISANDIDGDWFSYNFTTMSTTFLSYTSGAGYTAHVLPSSAAWAFPELAQLASPGLHWANPSRTRWQHMCCPPSASSGEIAGIVRLILRLRFRAELDLIVFLGRGQHGELLRKLADEERLFSSGVVGLASGWQFNGITMGYQWDNNDIKV